MAHNKLSKTFDLDTVFTLKAPNAIIASATTTTGTPYIDMSRAHYIAFIVTAIDTTLAGDVTAWVLEATATAAGLKTATALASATFGSGTTDASTAKILEVHASELDVASGYRYVTLKVKTAGADSIGVSIIRGPNRYAPADDYI